MFCAVGKSSLRAFNRSIIDQGVRPNSVHYLLYLSKSQFFSWVDLISIFGTIGNHRYLHYAVVVVVVVVVVGWTSKVGL